MTTSNNNPSCHLALSSGVVNRCCHLGCNLGCHQGCNLALSSEMTHTPFYLFFENFNHSKTVHGFTKILYYPDLLIKMMYIFSAMFAKVFLYPLTNLEIFGASKKNKG
jgi:hypothetical protein